MPPGPTSSAGSSWTVPSSPFSPEEYNLTDEEHRHEKAMDNWKLFLLRLAKRIREDQMIDVEQET